MSSERSYSNKRNCLWLGLPMLWAMPLPGQNADLSEVIPDLQIWDHHVTARALGGYKDNLLLSDTFTEQSYFLGAGADVTVWRLPVDGHQFYFVASGDYTYFPDGNQVDDESFAFAVAQYQKKLPKDWQSILTVQYYFNDQVFDASVTELIPFPVQVRGHHLDFKPALRKELAYDFWLEGQGIATRQFYASPLDDYWEGGPGLRFGKDYGHRSSVSLGYDFLHRAYDRRQPRDEAGGSIQGDLTYQQHLVETQWLHHWDEARHWRTVTKASIQWNQDNGGGYFDYSRVRCSQDVRYRTKTWEMKAGATFYYYDYARQTVSTVDLSHREKTLWALDFALSRKLTEHLKVKLQYDYQNSLSNRDLDEYEVNKVTAGVQWDF